jgi:hypothetical protein
VAVQPHGQSADGPDDAQEPADNSSAIPPGAVVLDLTRDDSPPPSPPVKLELPCTNCANRACFVCAQCAPAAPMIDLVGDDDSSARAAATGPAGKALCFECSHRLHQFDGDVLHTPECIDGPLRLEQQQTMETSLLATLTLFSTTAKGVLQKLRDIVLSEVFCPVARLNVLREEVESVLRSCERRKTLACVLGDTGAGKSSTLNACLGERSVLPTSGMRACTSSIVALSYNDRPGPNYRAVVEFLTQAEWDHEMDLILEDLRQQGDREKLIFRGVEADSPAAIAQAKLRVVYDCAMPESEAEFQKIRRHGSRITRQLGKNKEFQCDTADKFRRALEEYADSSDTAQGMSFWPIVKVINAFGPWNILRGGLTIMDVPGVADDNAARNAVVKRGKEPIRQLHFFVIAANLLFFSHLKSNCLLAQRL